MQKVHDFVIFRDSVDSVDQVAEIFRYIDVLVVAALACAVNQLIGEQVLAIINNKAFVVCRLDGPEYPFILRPVHLGHSSGIRKSFRDPRDLDIRPEGQPRLFHGQDRDTRRLNDLEAPDACGLPCAARAFDKDRKCHSHSPPSHGAAVGDQRAYLGAVAVCKVQVL